MIKKLWAIIMNESVPALLKIAEATKEGTE